MDAQQDETKKFIDFDSNINDDFEFYLNEVIAGVTDDKFDIDKHITSKFLFYHFNNLRRDLGKEAYKVRHTIVLDDQHALESLQSKDRSYFINCLLEVSSGGISLINLRHNDESKIINDTVENLKSAKAIM